MARRCAEFWSLVSKGDGCWEFTGYRTAHGYGRYQRGYAHRLSFEMANGAIPPGMFVCHRCDNPPCVRPDHLYLGTQFDNMRDMVARNRRDHVRGSRSPWAKLTEHDIVDIRSLRAFGAGVRELARSYGVDSGVLSRIITRQTWRHVL